MFEGLFEERKKKRKGEKEKKKRLPKDGVAGGGRIGLEAQPFANNNLN